MENEYTFNFEFWDHKLRGVLGMLNALSDYYMPPVEFDLIEENLEATNFEDNIWTDLTLSGNNHTLDLLLAKNQHEERRSIMIMISTKEETTTVTEEQQTVERSEQESSFENKSFRTSDQKQLILSEQIKTLCMFQGLFKDLELE
jgi:hypothetical protein